MMSAGKKFKSHGGSFVYEVQGPLCRLYDREELPWPSCSLAWKGKQPSWNRVGRRFVPDMGSMRFASYFVTGQDCWGFKWQGVHTMYGPRLEKKEADWWYSRRNQKQKYPDLCPTQEN